MEVTIFNGKTHYTVKGQSRSDSLLLSPYYWAKLFRGVVAIVAVPMRFAVICWIVLEAFVGQIHVFPLGSWMTIQVLGLSRISFLKSYREAVRLEKVQFLVSCWFLKLIFVHSFKVANAGCCLLAAAFLAAACLLACLPACLLLAVCCCCLLLLAAACCLLAGWLAGWLAGLLAACLLLLLACLGG